MSARPGSADQCLGCGNPIKQKDGRWVDLFPVRGQDPTVCRAAIQGHRPRPWTLRDEVALLHAHLRTSLEDMHRAAREADRQLDVAEGHRITGRMQEARAIMGRVQVILDSFPEPAPEEDDVVH